MKKNDRCVVSQHERGGQKHDHRHSKTNVDDVDDDDDEDDDDSAAAAAAADCQRAQSPTTQPQRQSLMMMMMMMLIISDTRHNKPHPVPHCRMLPLLCVLKFS